MHIGRRLRINTNIQSGQKNNADSPRSSFTDEYENNQTKGLAIVLPTGCFQTTTTSFIDGSNRNQMTSTSRNDHEKVDMKQMVDKVPLSGVKQRKY